MPVELNGAVMNNTRISTLNTIAKERDNMDLTYMSWLGINVTGI